MSYHLGAFAFKIEVMAKGKAKSKFNYEINPKTGKEIGCKYEDSGWCTLPKGRRCKDCLRSNGGNACYVMQ